MQLFTIGSNWRNSEGPVILLPTAVGNSGHRQFQHVALLQTPNLIISSLCLPLAAGHISWHSFRPVASRQYNTKYNTEIPEMGSVIIEIVVVNDMLMYQYKTFTFVDRLQNCSFILDIRINDIKS